MRMRISSICFAAIWSICLMGCDGCLDMGDPLEGRPCSRDGECKEGYVCNQSDKICAREGRFNQSNFNDGSAFAK